MPRGTVGRCVFQYLRFEPPDNGFYPFSYLFFFVSIGHTEEDGGGSSIKRTREIEKNEYKLPPESDGRDGQQVLPPSLNG